MGKAMTIYDQALDIIERLGRDELAALRARIDGALGGGAEGGMPTNGAMRSQACRLFTVPEGVRRLDKRQIEALTRSFEAWVGGSRDKRTRRSRERVFLVFQMLRYTGARLGEVLAMDEREHIDFIRGMVTIPDDSGKDRKREIPLPPELIGLVREYCAKYDDYQGSDSWRERLFDLDPGFVRRKFYEQEERSGLPRDLLNPRALRSSRAVELLQGGMPMRAVQALLGHSKTDFTASYVTMARGDLQHIIRQHCITEFSMDTSARNTFVGEVIAISHTAVMCEVVLKTDSGYEVAAVITHASRKKLGLETGVRATAMVKATWVLLERADSPSPTSARNAFPGKVVDVSGDEVVVEVNGVLDDGSPVCALVTAESFKRLGIKAGDPFIFMFKAMSVIVS